MAEPHQEPAPSYNAGNARPTPAAHRTLQAYRSVRPLRPAKAPAGIEDMPLPARYLRLQREVESCGEHELHFQHGVTLRAWCSALDVLGRSDALSADLAMRPYCRRGRTALRIPFRTCTGNDWYSRYNTGKAGAKWPNLKHTQRCTGLQIKETVEASEHSRLKGSYLVLRKIPAIVERAESERE